jgi:hypothetical protein
MTRRSLFALVLGGFVAFIGRLPDYPALGFEAETIERNDGQWVDFVATGRFYFTVNDRRVTKAEFLRALEGHPHAEYYELVRARPIERFVLG